MITRVVLINIGRQGMVQLAYEHGTGTYGLVA